MSLDNQKYKKGADLEGAYLDGFFYYPSTNCTYLMKEGTCIKSWRGNKPSKCNHGYYLWPKKINKCPI